MGEVIKNHIEEIKSQFEKFLGNPTKTSSESIIIAR